jgi:hypothetical protein
MMSRSKNFFTDDLQKLETACTGISNIISDRVDLLIKEDAEIAEHLETIEAFILYWQQHHKKLEEV